MEDQRPGGNPAQSRRREGKAHPETRQKHHGAAKAARPETETRGGWGGRARPGPPQKAPDQPSDPPLGDVAGRSGGRETPECVQALQRASGGGVGRGRWQPGSPGGGEEEEKARGGGSRPGKGTAKPPDPGPSDAIHTPPEQPLSPLSSHPRVTRQGHQPPAR